MSSAEDRSAAAGVAPPCPLPPIASPRCPCSTWPRWARAPLPRPRSRHAAELAVAAERLGYRRYWVAEHHNMPGIASSVAGGPDRPRRRGHSTIRVGSGGVMLPNHSPLVVAEQFGMLEALHPGPHRPRHRPGPGHRPGDRPGAPAQPRPASPPTSSPAELGELFGVLRRRVPRRPPLPAHHRRPGPRLPARASGCWVRATTAPRRGVVGAAVLVRPPLRRRRHRRRPSPCTASSFRPSADPGRPYVMFGVAVMCAGDATTTPAGWPGPARWRSPGCARAAPACTRPRRRRPSTCSRRSSASSCGRGGHRTLVGDPDARPRRAGRAGRADRRRRADDHHDGPRLRRTGVRSYELVAEVARLEPAAPLVSG